MITSIYAGHESMPLEFIDGACLLHFADVRAALSERISREFPELADRVWARELAHTAVEIVFTEVAGRTSVLARLSISVADTVKGEIADRVYLAWIKLVQEFNRKANP